MCLMLLVCFGSIRTLESSHLTEKNEFLKYKEREESLNCIISMILQVLSMFILIPWIRTRKQHCFFNSLNYPLKLSHFVSVLDMLDAVLIC